MKVVALLVLILALSEAFQWKVWESPTALISRTVTVVQSTATTFEVRAIETVARTWKSGVFRDAIDFLFSTVAIPHLTVRHYTQSGDNVEARAARHGLRKIIEYVEKGAAGSGFSPDQDQIVSIYFLWNNTWTPLSINQRTSATGIQITEICTSTTDGVVTICAYVTPMATTLSTNGTSAPLDNNAIHHSFRINKFPFKGTGSELALKVHFESKTIIRDMAPDTADNTNVTQLVGVDGDTIQPVATWANSVSVIGPGCAATAPVVRDIYRDIQSVNDIDFAPPLPVETIFIFNTHFTYFSFLTAPCQPTSIFWDPDIGIYDSSNPAHSLVPSLMIALIMLASLFI